MTIELAEQFEEQEQYEKAYDEYKKLLEKKPKSIDLLERAAHMAMICNRQEDATEFYNRILYIDATNVMAYEQLMDIYINSDKYKYYINRGNLHICQHQISHAINDFRKALDKATEEEQILSVRFVLADLYCQTAKYNNAIDEYLRILDSDSANLISFMNLSKIYEQQDSVSSAISTLEQAVERGFEETELKETLAKLYLKNNQPEMARKYTSDKLVAIRSLMEDGKEEQALEELKQIEKDYKKNPTYHSLLAQYYYQKGNYEQALVSVEDFEKFDKKSPLVYQMRALIFEGMDDSFNEHLNWGKYNLVRGDNDVALNEYMIALRFNEQDVDLVSTIANLLERMENKTQSIEFYERLFQLEPTNKKALEKIATFREEIGDYRMALNYFEKLFELDSKNTSTIQSLAVCYEKTKNKSKALEFYKKLPTSVENYAQIKQKIDKLEMKSKEYSNSEGESDGLLDWIMNLFNKNK